MKINFTIEPDVDADEYIENYIASVTMEDGTNFTVTGSETDGTFDAFRADTFEDLFCSLAQANGITVEIDVEDYAISVYDPEDPLSIGDISSFQPLNDDDVQDENDRTGC